MFLSSEKIRYRLAFLLTIIVIGGCGPSEDNLSAQLSSTAISLDDYRPVGVYHWSDADTSIGGQGQVVAELPCTAGSETYHVHSHLSIFLNGQQLALPANIGVVELGPKDACVYSLHTHDRTGKIHVESAKPGHFTLGQFFAIWGQPLSKTSCADFFGLPVVVYVADNGVLSEYLGDFTEIELISHREITVQIGSSVTDIPSYTWAGP